MFQSISFTGLGNSKLFGYAAELPFFKGRRKLEFKPGLNILFGPNGCGKSTVLGILADTMCARQGGVSFITEEAIRRTVNMLPDMRQRSSRDRSSGPIDNIGLKVVHDGQPVVYCDPRQSVGLSVGAFDEDFLAEGVSEVMTRGWRSHGQRTLARTNAALALLMDEKAKFPEEVRLSGSLANVNDLWAKGIEVARSRMQPGIERGQPSILLDEPEANYSLLWQARLWKLLAKPEIAQRYQVIVATHSAFALAIPGAHYIDFVEGYRDEVEAMLYERFRTARA